MTNPYGRGVGRTRLTAAGVPSRSATAGLALLLGGTMFFLMIERAQATPESRRDLLPAVTTASALGTPQAPTAGARLASTRTPGGALPWVRWSYVP